jgi:hypothetical protein
MEKRSPLIFGLTWYYHLTAEEKETATATLLFSIKHTEPL